LSINTSNGEEVFQDEEAIFWTIPPEDEAHVLNANRRGPRDREKSLLPPSPRSLVFLSYDRGPFLYLLIVLREIFQEIETSREAIVVSLPQPFPGGPLDSSFYFPL